MIVRKKLIEVALAWRYLDEYVFRYTNRDAGEKGMLTAILSRVEKLGEKLCSRSPS